MPRLTQRIVGADPAHVTLPVAQSRSMKAQCLAAVAQRDLTFVSMSVVCKFLAASCSEGRQQFECWAPSKEGGCNTHARGLKLRAGTCEGPKIPGSASWSHCIGHSPRREGGALAHATNPQQGRAKFESSSSRRRMFACAGKGPASRALTGRSPRLCANA